MSFVFERVKKKRAAGITILAGSIIGLLIQLVAFGIPAPEIYTTNGNLKDKNSIYFKAEWPLTIWYTTTPYADPQDSGIKYEEDIPIDRSMIISAKASFFGLKWSELESRDIIIGEDSHIDIVKTDTPGISVKEISANIIDEKLFPGDELTKDKIEVEGITISGEKVPIIDFEFYPQEIEEGMNEITVKYEKLQYKILYLSEMAKLDNLRISYIGKELIEGSEISKDDFKVWGIYEDGTEKAISDFKISPLKAETPGKLRIVISKDDISRTISVNVKESPKLFSNAFEKHTPNDVTTLISFDWWDDSENKDARGDTHEDGGLYLSIGNMFNQLGSKLANTITSDIHMVLNPDYINRGKLSGDIVVETSSLGTDAYATISILVDDEVKWKTQENITGTTIEPVHFEVDLSDAETEVIIRVECVPKQNGLSIGFVNFVHANLEND